MHVMSRQDRYGETLRRYVADGHTTTFFFPFSVFSIHDLQVWVDNVLYDRGYRVLGSGRRRGGSVVFEAPPPEGTRITLKRHLLITRKAGITIRGQLSASGINTELDSHIALMRQLEGEITRCLTWPPGVPIAGGGASSGLSPAGRPVLPLPQPGQALGWSDDGRYLVNTPSVLVRLAHMLEQLHTAGVLADLPPEIRDLAAMSAPPVPRGEVPTRLQEDRHAETWATAALQPHAMALSDEQAWTLRVIQALQDTLQDTVEATQDEGTTAPLMAAERFGEIVPTVYLRAFPGRMPHVVRLSRSSGATCLNRHGTLIQVAAETLRDDFSPDGETYQGWLIEGTATNHLRSTPQGQLKNWRSFGMQVMDIPAPSTAFGSVASLDVSAVGIEATTLDARLISPPLSDVPDRGVFSLWMRRLKGSGSIQITSDQGVTWHDVSEQVTEGGLTRVWVPMRGTTCAPGIRVARPRDAVVVAGLQYEASLGPDPRPTSTIITPVSSSSGSLSGGQSTSWTRDGDVLRVDDIRSRMTAAEGTIYIEAILGVAADNPQTLFSSSATPVAVEASVGDLAKGISLNVGGIASGFSGSTTSGQPVKIGVPFRCAVSWHRDGILALHDGIVFCESQRGKPWSCQALALGCQLRDGPTRFLYGWIRRCAIFPQRLTRQHLVAMTQA